MNKDDVKALLRANGFHIDEEIRIKNDTGWQFRLANGAIVNVYDTGTVTCQGKGKEEIEALLKQSDGPGEATSSASRSIFVVYGHDEAAKTNLEAMLRRWDLEPLFLDQLPSGGQTIIEKLEKYSNQANYAVVLATPDDEGNKAGKQDEMAFRARQNVVLELGMMLATVGRANVAILLKGQEAMERPSDIQGLVYIPFKDDVKEAGLQLAKEMNARGIPIDISKI